MRTPKRLSLPGLYIINKFFSETNSSRQHIIVFDVTDSYSQKKRSFRFDAGSIAATPPEALHTIEQFIRSGQVPAASQLKPLATPAGYSQSITLASFERVRNQPCLVRYTYAGENIGMIFYPHEFSF